MPRVLEVGHRGQQVRQRSAEPVQLPDHQAVARPDESERIGQAGTIAATAAGPILEQVPLVDAGGEERVTLQVQHLPVAVGGDAHVADQHVRKTSSGGFPHNAPFRQGLSCSFRASNGPHQATSAARRESTDSRHRDRHAWQSPE